MADEIFRQKREKITKQDLEMGPPDAAFETAAIENPLDRVQEMQRNVLKETGKDVEGFPGLNPSLGSGMKNPDVPFQMSGNIPPQLQALMGNKGPESTMPKPVPRQTMQQTRKTGSDELESLLEQLASFNQWEAIELPSKGKFYSNIPPTLHIRPMTGEEEQILATPRFVRKGKSIDMLFSRCLKERINTEELLSIDRTYLVIYLRGISHTPEYDAEITCPSCATKYNTTIDLNGLQVTSCPDDFNLEQLTGVLPTTGWRFKYRLATGADEMDIRRHMETMTKEYGDDREDDTLLYRTATLLENLQGVTDRNELIILIKKLPVSDVAHLRNTIAGSPFGVDTKIGQICPACYTDFEIELPVDIYFFFPRKKTG